jgi:hypothetical protein
MTWWLLGAVSCVALVVALELRRRHLAYWEGPHLMQQWRDFAAKGEMIRPDRDPAR